MPLLSFLTPVADPEPEAFARCCRSILEQSRSDWEWCIADNGSADPTIREMLRDLDRHHDNVTVTRSDQNLGIAGGSNLALEHACGEFLALVDHDDEVSIQTTATVADVLQGAGDDVDYLYSDEELLDESGARVALFEKPAWSPSRFRSQMYCGHLSILRRELVEAVGGFNSEFDGSQDYDLVLRVSEAARRIIHIPEVLYSWRAGSESTALDPLGKPWAYAAGIRAVQAHCDRVGIEAEVVGTEIVGVHRLRRVRPEEPLVSIVIPTAGAIGDIWGKRELMVEQCIQSVLNRSSYKNLEVICVVDGSLRAPERFTEMQRTLESNRVRYVQDQGTFNFSRKINVGAFHARGDLLVLLNDDTEVIATDWIEAMIRLIEEGDVGVVGALLQHPDATLQHGGQYLNGLPHHMLYGFPCSMPGPMSALHVERECIGVTAACAMTRRDVFEQVGGFRMDLPNNYNDVDYCLKVVEQGLRVVWTPWARLWHHESSSRRSAAQHGDSEATNLVRKSEQTFMRSRWADFVETDPFITDDVRVDLDRPRRWRSFR